jgi:hypothetical protein
MLDGVYCDPIVQDSFQESVFAEFTGQLYRYRPAADDLAYLAGVGMAAPPGEQVTDEVAPMAEVPCLQLLAMEVGDVGVGLAVLAGFVAELPEVRVPCELEQLGFSTWRLGLGPSYFGRLAQGQFAPQEG